MLLLTVKVTILFFKIQISKNSWKVFYIYVKDFPKLVLFFDNIKCEILNYYVRKIY